MARYIDADLEVSKYVTVWDCDCSEFGKQTVMAVDDLQYLPTADVALRAVFAREILKEVRQAVLSLVLANAMGENFDLEKRFAEIEKKYTGVETEPPKGVKS